MTEPAIFIDIDNEMLNRLLLIEKHYTEILEKCVNAKLENPYSEISNINLIDKVINDIQAKAKNP